MWPIIAAGYLCLILFAGLGGAAVAAVQVGPSEPLEILK